MPSSVTVFCRISWEIGKEVILIEGADSLSDMGVEGDASMVVFPLPEHGDIEWL